MDAFFHANHTTRVFDAVSTPGYRLVGELQLDPGKYVVLATAQVGTPVVPTSLDSGGGALVLSLAGSQDTVSFALRPESGGNMECVSTMVAAQTA